MALSMVAATTTSRERALDDLIMFVGLFLAFTVVWPFEFTQDSHAASALYATLPGLFGVRIIDAVLLGGCVMIVLPRLLFESGRLSVSWEMKRALALFALAVGIAMVYGIVNGGTQLFYEVRNPILATIFALAFVPARGNERALGIATAALLSVLTIQATFFLARFLVAGSDLSVATTSVPVADGPTIGNACFASAVGLAALFGNKLSGARRVALSYSFLVCSLLVLLSLRRSYWGVLLLAACIVLLATHRRRGAILALLSVALLIGYLLLPTGVATQRIASISSRTDVTNPYSADNDDHLSDVLDALDVVKGSPILGIGLGRPYYSPRTKSWKSESWGVHNAVLHVWLKFTILGLFAYVAFHGALLRWLKRRAALLDARRSVSLIPALALGTLAYVAGTFVVGLTFSPWPFGSLQVDLVIASAVIIVASAEVAEVAQPAQDTVLAGGSER